MAEDQDTEKTHQPTQKKLDDLRKKGEVVRSTDLGVAAAYGGFLLAFMILGADVIGEIGAALSRMFDTAPALADSLFAPGGQMLAGTILKATTLPLFVLFLVPAVCVLLCFIAQRGLVFSAAKLKPRRSRISPLANLKNKFGPSGLFEFAKSFIKLLIYSAILWWFLLAQTDEIVAMTYNSPAMNAQFILSKMMAFLSIVLLIAVLIGTVDYLWQRYDHQRKNMMSHQEVREEHKTQEGDPHMKQQRRQRGQMIAMNQMLADVPEADVVIVNPEHYAVALKWERHKAGAPICVAKGVDEIALRIREIARKEGIAIRRDPPTARALHATVDIGQEVSPDHYRVVAAAIRYADRLKAKAGARNGQG